MFLHRYQEAKWANVAVERALLYGGGTSANKISIKAAISGCVGISQRHSGLTLSLSLAWFDG